MSNWLFLLQRGGNDRNTTPIGGYERDTLRSMPRLILDPLNKDSDTASNGSVAISSRRAELLSGYPFVVRPSNSIHQDITRECCYFRAGTTVVFSLEIDFKRGEGGS